MQWGPQTTTFRIRVSWFSGWAARPGFKTFPNKIPKETHSRTLLYLKHYILITKSFKGSFGVFWNEKSPKSKWNITLSTAIDDKQFQIAETKPLNQYPLQGFPFLKPKLYKTYIFLKLVSEDNLKLQHREKFKKKKNGKEKRLIFESTPAHLFLSLLSFTTCGSEPVLEILPYLHHFYW